MEFLSQTIKEHSFEPRIGQVLLIDTVAVIAITVHGLYASEGGHHGIGFLFGKEIFDYTAIKIDILHANIYNDIVHP